MKEEKEWFVYEPEKEEDKKMSYAWRTSARNMNSCRAVFPTFSLEVFRLDSTSQFDEWFLKERDKEYPVRIYGNGYTVVEDPRIEFECMPSEKDLVNKLIGDLNL